MRQHTEMPARIRPSIDNSHDVAAFYRGESRVTAFYPREPTKEAVSTFLFRSKQPGEEEQ